MTNEVKNVPELRFPEFDGEWRLNIFDDMVSNKSSKYSPNNNESIIDIELDSIESNTGRLIKSYTSNEFSSQKNVFKKNQVLYSKLRPYLNKYHFPKFDGVCTSEIWVLDSKNKSILSNEFLYYFIQTSKFSEVTNKSAGSKMPRADWSLVGDLRLNIASIKEQGKIIRFFSKLDRQIELEEQKLAKLEEQKKGYMQQIFSQQLRFKNENGNDYPEWEEKAIKDVYKITRGYVLAKKLMTDIPNSINKYPVYSSQTGNNGLMGFYSDYLYQDAITWTTDGANAGRVSFRQGKFYCTNVCGVLLNELGNSNACMAEMLNNIAFKYVSKVGNPKLMNNVMAMIKLKFPCLEEQQVISKFLNVFSEAIYNQNKKVELLKERKKGFLQKMFV
ncbi:restriction endonuclease subunit S [Staphylococcus xylosus]|uniref:restriction endonuclease subunit S n=1 Tax=Staphylococcus xylosus TaxID=1288 RepID=UPI003F99B65E